MSLRFNYFIMKALAIFAILLSVSTQGLRAQEKLVEKVQPEVTLAFDFLEYNFGEIDLAGDGTCTFTFYNKGKEPLLLTNVNASCGCTTPSWTRDPIQPGEKGEIKVKYNTNIQGSFNKAVVVNSNGTPSVITLRVKGVVKPRVVETEQK